MCVDVVVVVAAAIDVTKEGSLSLEEEVIVAKPISTTPSSRDDFRDIICILDVAAEGDEIVTGTTVRQF